MEYFIKLENLNFCRRMAAHFYDPLDMATVAEEVVLERVAPLVGFVRQLDPAVLETEKNRQSGTILSRSLYMFTLASSIHSICLVLGIL